VVCYNDFMLVFGALTAVRTSMIFLAVAATIASAASALASGAQASRRSDAQVRQAPSVTGSNRRNHSIERHPQHRDSGFQRRRRAPVIVVPSAAYYYSPYYIPRAAVVNAPFFCLEHGVGFVSRVGLIDHLGGTHKFALQHAAAICPDDVDTCLFEGVWPLY
jgi:hypothetical protein